MTTEHDMTQILADNERLRAENAALTVKVGSLTRQRDHWEQQGWETLLARTALLVARMPADSPMRQFLEMPLPLGTGARPRRPARARGTR